MRQESKEDAVTVYYDDRLKGHAFFYQHPKTHKCTVSAGVYDRLDDCETSAYLCLFAETDEVNGVTWQKDMHCETVSIH